MVDWIKGIVAIIILGFGAWVLINATSYNTSEQDTCKDHGMVWVREYPFGDYGCANVIPTDEVGK